MYTKILEAKENAVDRYTSSDLFLTTVTQLFQPCPGDSADTNSLVNQRASETCRRMLTNGALNSTMYTAVGKAYNSHGKLVNIPSNTFYPQIGDMAVL